MKKRVGGTIAFQIDGEVYNAKGNFTYHLGTPTREAVVGSSGVHGFKETHMPAYIEGEITDPGDVDLRALATATDVTATLQLANGKGVVLRDAWYAGEAVGNTEEGNVAVRFEAEEGEEV